MKTPLNSQKYQNTLVAEIWETTSMFQSKPKVNPLDIISLYFSFLFFFFLIDLIFLVFFLIVLGFFFFIYYFSILFIFLYNKWFKLIVENVVSTGKKADAKKNRSLVGFLRILQTELPCDFNLEIHARSK